MNFINPHWLFLLAALPLFLLPSGKTGRKNRAGVPFPAAGSAFFRQSGRGRFIFIPGLLRAVSFILLVAALARPAGELVETEKKTEGIALQLVIDRSGSMGALTNFGNKEVTRLAIVKKVLEDFIYGDGDELPGRNEDLLGLISFARYADTLFPLSLSHDPLRGFINSLQLADTEEEDGTSIGDALALACARLGTPELESGGDGGYHVKSRVVVLITDGASNAGRLSPEEAAELARDLGIKIYCVGFGGDAWVRRSGLFGQQKVPVGSSLDIETLRGISNITGGQFWLAEDGDSLLDIYQQIDELEKTRVETVEYKSFREHYRIFVLLALLALGLAIILDHTLFRRSP